jgi:hypothetical protein
LTGRSYISVEEAGCGVLVVEPVGAVVEEVALLALALLVLATASRARTGTGTRSPGAGCAS